MYVWWKTKRLELDPRELASHKRKARHLHFPRYKFFQFELDKGFAPRLPQWPENFSRNIGKWFPTQIKLNKICLKFQLCAIIVRIKRTQNGNKPFLKCKYLWCNEMKHQSTNIIIYGTIMYII